MNYKLRTSYIWWWWFFGTHINFSFRSQFSHCFIVFDSFLVLMFSFLFSCILLFMFLWPPCACPGGIKEITYLLTFIYVSGVWRTVLHNGVRFVWDIATGLAWTPNGVGSLEPRGYCIFLPGVHYLTINSPDGADSSLYKLLLLLLLCTENVTRVPFSLSCAPIFNNKIIRIGSKAFRAAALKIYNSLPLLTKLPISNKASLESFNRTLRAHFPPLRVQARSTTC